MTKKSKDGKNITESEFLEYYADVNATLPYEKENYFVDLILRTWGLTSDDSYISGPRLSELETILFEKIRQKTKLRQDEGATVIKAFKYFDLMNTGRASKLQFW